MKNPLPILPKLKLTSKPVMLKNLKLTVHKCMKFSYINVDIHIISITHVVLLRPPNFHCHHGG